MELDIGINDYFFASPVQDATKFLRKLRVLLDCLQKLNLHLVKSKFRLSVYGGGALSIGLGSGELDKQPSRLLNSQWACR
ncbi:hypothetical protein [Oscillibacter sp. 1-3]|uniref:hypothetical protein n=1 Tax=Oscillibacter sp. 1-3 TaxID=1235797 RepID=UPI001FA70B3B|nr:hypothetical protein [Oscillibacter sp. 1-3]